MTKSIAGELKNDIRLLFTNRQLLTLCFAVLVSMLGFGLVMPLLPLYARYFGASILEVSLLTASFAITRIITTLPGGWLADRSGRKLPIIAGLFSYSIVMTLFAFSQDVYQLIILRGLQGAASGFVWPVISTMVGDIVRPKDRSKAMGLYEMMWYLGLAIGPAIGGVVSAFFGLGAPFFVCGALAFVSMLLVVFTVKETSRNHSGIKINEANVKQNAISKKLPWLTFYPRVFLGLCVAGFAISFSQSLIQPILSIYSKEQLGFSEIAIGMLFTVNGLANFFLTLPAGTMADRLGRNRVVFLGMVVDAVSTALIAGASDYWLLLVIMAGRGVGHASSNPSISAMICGLVPVSGRGKVMGVFNLVRNVGLVAGSLIGGLLYQSVSLVAPFLACSIMGFAGVSILFFTTKGHTESCE